MKRSVSSKPSLVEDIKLIPYYWETFLILSWRNLRLYYHSPLLVFCWNVVSPLLMASIFYIVLNKRVGVDIPHYFIYVLSGIIFWHTFVGGLSQAYPSFLQHADMVKQIYFPRFLLPLTFLASKLIDFFIAFTVFVCCVLISDLELNWFAFIVYSVLGIINFILVSTGIYLAFSVIYVRFKSFQMFYPFLIQSLFFSSPIVYNPFFAIENETIQTVLEWNPIAGILYIFRSGIFTDSGETMTVVFYTLYSAIVFIVGFVWFRMEDIHLADRL
ncbi:ABC transporter permease [Arenicella xantha]|uniref:Transport permease protein n=1 Tax=Arenicella xantha TaxID=644221 RepID=A0A395JTP6_9GAMM|nr:ABC transporter permease [Arenicella xantha]RBP52958.1 ABC-type polysaccharide/polyol phosphate export permease [Arenicella xantha]